MKLRPLKIIQIILPLPSDFENNKFKPKQLKIEKVCFKVSREPLNQISISDFVKKIEFRSTLVLPLIG